MIGDGVYCCQSAKDAGLPLSYVDAPYACPACVRAREEWRARMAAADRRIAARAAETANLPGVPWSWREWEEWRDQSADERRDYHASRHPRT